MKQICASIAAGLTAAVVGVGVLAASPQAPSPTAAPEGGVHAGDVRGTGARPSYTLVLGDSIAHRSRAELKALRPAWIVDAVDGRNVDRLLPLLESWIDRKGRAPGQLVVELGTNWSHDWEGVDYQRVRRLVPRARITFVTPYRAVDAASPRSTGAFAHRRTGEYADSMRSIAAEAAGICVAEWREGVASRSRLLADGVHPTASGRGVWAQLITDAVTACRAETTPPV